MYYTKNEDDSQVLHDRDQRGKERPWNQKKSEAMIISMAYEVINDHKRAVKIRSCASSLIFSPDNTGKIKLKSAAFCRSRLCPVCQWRRSLKVYGQTRQIIEYLKTKKPYKYIMLTLTAPAVQGDKLKTAINEMHKAWQRLTQRQEVKSAVKGWMRATEITYNREKDTYHHHIHAILCVMPSYFTGRTYITHDRWLQLWKESTRDYTITQIDVRRCGTMDSAAAEVAKYATKPSDYLDPSDLDMMSEIIKTIDSALVKTRCVSWGGCMADAHKALALDDAEEGDLIHTSDINEEEITQNKELVWDWTPGPRLYLKRGSEKWRNQN